MGESKETMVCQSVNIFDRKKIEIVGAVEVISSTEKEVHIKLQDSFMQVFGEKLTILKLIPEEKLLSISGVINGINYPSKLTKKSLLGKVFK